MLLSLHGNANSLHLDLCIAPNHGRLLSMHCLLLPPAYHDTTYRKYAPLRRALWLNSQDATAILCINVCRRSAWDLHHRPDGRFLLFSCSLRPVRHPLSNRTRRVSNHYDGLICIMVHGLREAFALSELLTFSCQPFQRSERKLKSGPRGIQGYLPCF